VRVLLCNNFVRGNSGVDAVVQMEADALRAAGHEVALYARNNTELDRTGISRWRMMLSSVYSRQTLQDVTTLVNGNAFDAVHIHNTVPLISGSIHTALQSFKGAIIQHLHNYRFFCPASYAFRNGRPCRLCSRTGGLPCLWFRCYRNSAAAGSGLIAARLMDATATFFGGRRPDLYVAVSECVRDACIREGLPSRCVTVIPNPVRDLKPADLSPSSRIPERRLIFVGTLLSAKGVLRLPELARHLPGFRFDLVGSGTEEKAVREAIHANRLQNMVLHGPLDGEALRRVWADAFLTLVPSEWDEPFGLVAAESLSLGIPVATTGRGALGGIVTEGDTGIVGPFRPAGALADRITTLWNDHDRYARMCVSARSRYEQAYTPAAFVQALMSHVTALLEAPRCA